jgi:hypothetical protein
MPRKALYEELRSDGSVRFAFDLAHLLRRSVAELDEMDHREYVQWYVYFGQRAQEAELAEKMKRGG